MVKFDPAAYVPAVAGYFTASNTEFASLGITSLFVTHDQAEAIEMLGADKLHQFDAVTGKRLL